MATSLELDGDFESWLTTKLNSLNTDEGIFGSYITGILTGDETLEEKNEALEGIIGEITEKDISFHCQEILDKWAETQKSKKKVEESLMVGKAPGKNMEEQLVKLMEKNTMTTTVQKEYTAEERKLREVILAQYSQSSDQEDGEEPTVYVAKENGLEKNTNVQTVIQAQKEKREKAKIDCQKKKDKDREDREKQKKEAAEKKEKRKTQKGERRR